MLNQHREYQQFQFELGEQNSYTLVRASEEMKGHILIPSFYRGKPITQIGDYAFLTCKKLETITIPTTVYKVGCCAFAECSALEKLVLEGYVELIDKAAFYNCINLSDVEFKNNVGKIRKDAFESCNKIGFLNLEEATYSFPEKCVFDSILSAKYF
ncbi:MAG: leucine-rich repeat domain-containing protein [Ruminococcaceae bacterium]|nr:leucine-rich repeat domain-containing protein [Oscillospiraceae bacterium]